MARIDPEQEKRRLVEFYSGQMNGELEQVASQAYDLTDPAREALRAELGKRGLSVRLIETTPVIPVKARVVLPGDPPPLEPRPVKPLSTEGELESRVLVTIRSFRDLPDALLAKGSLESAGIESFLVDDNVVRMDWFWSNLMGGIKLEVDPEDAEAANEILDQPIPEGFDVAGIGEYAQPRCPKCQSLDVNFQEVDRPVAYVSAYFNVPIPLQRRAWRCHSCEAEWEDDSKRDS
jgi:hypothetical protein